MFLKRVTVCGFKSFCDRVDFDFGPGITCIVGPNGCGKSNVVDAFKWVLGEQSARSLRGRQMADMIFNGCSTRRSSSVAQVDLVFDNVDRALDMDQDEVTVTRKLYRSGESEYLLNRQPVRLKDVREMFMDTGVGVDAYSVIEQGRVDGLLQSSPTERRIIFEEAAGISKYKARRREAERKLDRTQQNLLRVEDIIEELERRLRSVKVQAGRARSFKEYEARLNELRSSYALAEFHRFTGDIDRLDRDVARHTDQVISLHADIDRNEAENAELTLELDDLAEQISTSDNELVQAKTNLAAHEERIESATKRIEEQEALHRRSQDRLAGDSQRLAATEDELANVQESAVSLQRRTHELHAQIDELNEADRTLARDLTQAQAVLEDEKAGIIELLRRSAQTHNEIIRLNTHRESLVGQKGRLSERDAQIATEVGSNLQQRAELAQHIEEIESLIERECRTLEEKKAEATRANAMRQQLLDASAEAKERRSALLSRRELLRDLNQKMEGVGTAARQLLEGKLHEREEGPLACVAGVVADLFEADVDHARIIEAALGPFDQYLVVTDSQRFLAYLESIGELPGRLTALCLDRLPPVINERDFSDQPGFVARALDLVRVPAAFEIVARHLLGKTVVVADRGAALRMASLDHAGHRFVTLACEVVEPDGRIALGPDTSSGGLISRKSELRDIDAQLSTIGERIATITDQLDRTQAQVSHLEDVQQELRTAIYESNTAKVEANATIQSIDDTIERLAKEQPLIAREVTLIEQQINDVHEKSEQGGASLKALEQENEDREARVAAQQERIDEIVEERKRAQERLTEARVNAGQLTEKRAAAAETINNLRRTLHELQQSVATAKHDIEQCCLRLADAQATVNNGREQIAVLSTRIETLENQSAQLRNRRESLRLEIDGRVQAVKAARTRLAEVESQLHERQMSLAETKVRRDELVGRVREELHIDLVERYEQYEYAEQDWEQVEAEIAELRQKMDRLGNVNLDAINELQELEERHGFLAGQRDDLTDSYAQLERLIAKLNAESRDRFIASLDQIRDHFRGMFRKLFGGGKADIILEDPENVLECGIEIVAQPPGKELQAITLMSGGEKSMTAIALLMSIFKSRPAPFAILDEVDAALDEANNERFNRIVKEFVSESQFIVITHSKWSMNIADRLYGITMHEPGISTRVSVQLSGTNVA